MARNNLRLVKPIALGLAVIVGITLIVLFIDRTNRNPEGDFGYKPLLTYNGALYGHAQELSELPKDAYHIADVQESYGTALKPVDISDGDLVSNVFEKGDHVFVDQSGNLYVESGNIYVKLEKIE